MGRRDLVMAVGLAAALALPAASAGAAGGRGQSALHAHMHGRGHKTGQTSTPSGKSSLVHKNVRQFEGMVVAVSPQGLGTSAAAAASGLQVRTMGSRPVTVTVLLTASTQLSVEQAATGTVAQSAGATQLTVGQRVHVMATPSPDGTYTAVRIIIQSQESEDSATTDTDSSTPGRPEDPGRSPH